MKTSAVFTFLLITFLHINLKAQKTQAFDYVTWPKSVSSFGMGQMGVASLSNDDALVYNPAQLSLTKNTRISFYRNPLIRYWGPIPFSSLTIFHKDNDAGSFALSYENRDHEGKPYSIYDEIFPGIYWEDHMNSSEGSVTAAYGKNLNENFSAGIQLRYAYWNSNPASADVFLFSLGGLYTPDFLTGVTLGFSLMNLGPAVKPETSYDEIYHSDPPPAKLNLGLNFIAVENDHLTFPLNIGFSKPFDKRDDNFEGQSSFKTIFTDWKDFPNDASLHTGLAFIWKPFFFNNDFGFFQEFFFGNYSRGIKTGLLNFYTHAFNFGLELYEFKISAGYAGISHNVHYPQYSYRLFPYETFQVSLELNNDLLFKKVSESSRTIPKSLIISLGVGQTLGLGDIQIIIPPYQKYSLKNSLNYSLETSFYFDEGSALISSFAYNSFPGRFNYEISVDDQLFTYLIRLESFSLFSSYRYHPLDVFTNLFIQGGLGIFRFNQISNYGTNQYEYKSALQLAAGLMLDFTEPVIIIPSASYNLILTPAEGDAPRIGGYSQLNFAMKIGYRIF